MTKTFKTVKKLSARMAMAIWACCQIVTFSSCSSDDASPITPDETQQGITFTASIKGSTVAGTRTEDTTDSDWEWVEGDAVGIFMTNTAYKLPEDYHKANKKYMVDATETLVELFVKEGEESNALYYPANGDPVEFIAYYPYKDLSDDETTGSGADKVPGIYPVAVEDDQSAESVDTRTFDLLRCKTESTESSRYNKNRTDAVAMAFNHMLSKVVINVALGTDMSGVVVTNGESNKITIKINGIPITANFNLADCSFDFTDVDGSGVTTYQLPTPNVVGTTEDKYACSHEAIIVPHGAMEESKYSARTITFQLADLDNQVWTYYIPNTTSGDNATTYKSFASGMKTVYNFTLTRKGIKFEGVTVNDWGKDGNDINVSDLY